jgi:hypothetical protein
MAVDFKVKGSRTSEYRFLPKDIKIKPELNGRHDLPDIEWLISDILKRGQIQPVAIRNDGGIPVLCAGFSRYRAVHEINKRKLTPVPLELRCTYIKCSEHEGFLAGISENRMRNSTTEMDDAANVYRCVQIYGMTEEDVAKTYFPVEMNDEVDEADPLVQADRKKALKWVREKLALVNLTSAAKVAMREGRLKGSAALAFAKLTQEEQIDRLEASGPGKIKAPGKSDSKPTLKQSLQQLIDTGKLSFRGESCTVPDLLVEYLIEVLRPRRAKLPFPPSVPVGTH